MTEIDPLFLLLLLYDVDMLVQIIMSEGAEQTHNTLNDDVTTTFVFNHVVGRFNQPIRPICFLGGFTVDRSLVRDLILYGKMFFDMSMVSWNDTCWRREGLVCVGIP